MKRFIAAVLTAVVCTMPLGLSAAETASPAQNQLDKLQWRSIGPYIGGRVVAVAGVPSRPSTFYFGGVQSGIWRSDNYGQSWENISDDKLPRTATSIGAIAVSNSNPKVIYAGTGEGDPRGDFDTGEGIYKSTDAGKTWHYAGLRDTHTTTSLAIHPSNPNIVYVTSLGHVFKPNPERGVFKTTDGGATWSKVLYVDDKTGGNDVVMDPRNPNTLYATMWQMQRTPWHLESGGPGSGLYKTTDGGAHWAKISRHPGFAHGLLGKMGVAVAPSNPRIVYAIVQAKDGGVFRSTDAGATWKRVNSEWKLRQRAFYYMAIYVSPKNPNVVYAPNVDSVWKSTDGGKTWKPMGGSGDHHIVWINPNDPSIILEGDDGGATVSVDGGKTWSSENNQPTGQFYHITLDKQFPYHVYGAQQDEGAYEGPSASHEGLTLGEWHNVAYGESTYVAVDPRTSALTYGSGYDSSLLQSNLNTGDLKNVSPWPRYLAGASASETKYRFGWTHPILFSPARPDELFETAQVVFKSTDFGQNWKAISPDLTRNDPRTEVPTGGPIDLDQTGAEMFPDIASLGISPLDGDIMWAGSADGLVHVTTNGGAQWKLVTPPQLPQSVQISSIEPSRIDKATAYLTASGYMWDDFHPYIFKTTDYGAHWTAITNGLPDDQYVFVVRQDPREPRLMFAGTRSTVYVSLNGGGTWQPLTLNLPGVQVRDIAIDARQGQVAAATHGRAFWILDNLAFLEQMAARNNAPVTAATVFAPETAWLTHAYGGGGGSSSGQNPEYGATVFFNIPKNYDGKTPVTLSFLDANGKTVRSFSLHLKNKKAKTLQGYQLVELPQTELAKYNLERLTAIEPGMNTFQWDMRYTPATEVNGLRIDVTNDFSERMLGPTITPGTYSVVLDYGGTKTTQSFKVALDPRIRLASGDLEARLALATRISNTLNSLDTAINDAMAARPRMSAAKRSQLDNVLAHVVEFNVFSTEGSLLHRTWLHAHLAFLMNELDGAYQAPTTAEYTTYDELRGEAATAIAQLKGLTR